MRPSFWSLFFIKKGVCWAGVLYCSSAFCIIHPLISRSIKQTLFSRLPSTSHNYPHNIIKSYPTVNISQRIASTYLSTLFPSIHHFNILLTSRNKRHHTQTVLNLLTHPRNFHTQTAYDWQCYVSSFPLGGFATRTEPLGSPDLKHMSTKCGLCAPSVSCTSHNINCHIYHKSYSSLLLHPICLEEVTFVMTVIQQSCALQICVT